MIILVCLANPITYILTILTLVIDIQVGIILFDRVKKYNNVLTEKGRKEKEKWLGFKKYVEDYSILDERKAEEDFEVRLTSPCRSGPSGHLTASIPNPEIQSI